MQINDQYLDSVKKNFRNYKNLGEKAMEQLEPVSLFKTYNDDSNSIAIIVKHLWGNMLSRWTDFLTTDGEKTWRERDAEFENDMQSKEELMQKWNEGWNCLFNTLDSLKPEQLLDIVTIRSEEHTVMDAIHRQLTHSAYHVGQIVYAVKMFKGVEFESLSIPKGQSKQFNAAMFGKE